MSAFHGSLPLRLTPSNSPFLRSPSPRSPTKPTRDEPCLHLLKSIGTTTTAVTSFDALSSPPQFAYTAGAAAVVVTVDNDLNVNQHFFRAKPSSSAGARDAAWPLSPSPNDPRYRPGSQLKDAVSASPLGAASRDWSDSPNGRSATAKDRIKSITSVALSPNGKWVALVSGVAPVQAHRRHLLTLELSGSSGGDRIPPQNLDLLTQGRFVGGALLLSVRAPFRSPRPQFQQ